MGICHRDIKPQNLLLDPESAILKLCDFGSAKQLVKGELNVSYICSRYYRAPELIFGATDYTCNIDIWSAGCVLAELLLGQPIFPGDSGVDQLVEIIKVLGTPTREQIRQMNPNYQEFKFPQIRAHPWNKVFRPRTPPEAIHLASKLLEYTPSSRITPLEACAHAFFDELREPNNKLPNGRDLPPLFNLTPHEQTIQPNLNSKLIPPHYQAESGTSTTSTNFPANGASTQLAGSPTNPGSSAAATLANVATASAAVSASTTTPGLSQQVSTSSQQNGLDSKLQTQTSATSSNSTSNNTAVNGNTTTNTSNNNNAASATNGTSSGSSQQSQQSGNTAHNSILSHANINNAVDSLSLNSNSTNNTTNTNVENQASIQ